MTLLELRKIVNNPQLDPYMKVILPKSIDVGCGNYHELVEYELGFFEDADFTLIAGEREEDYTINAICFWSK